MAGVYIGNQKIADIGGGTTSYPTLGTSSGWRQNLVGVPVESQDSQEIPQLFINTNCACYIYDNALYSGNAKVLTERSYGITLWWGSVLLDGTITNSNSTVNIVSSVAADVETSPNRISLNIYLTEAVKGSRVATSAIITPYQTGINTVTDENYIACSYWYNGNTGDTTHLIYQIFVYDTNNNANLKTDQSNIGVTVLIPYLGV